MIDGEASGQNPVSFELILGEPIIYHQIMQLKNLGIERFIITIDVVDIKALTLADRLKTSGILIEFITSVNALGDILRADDEFIMISDAIWCNDDHIYDALICPNEQILVIQNCEENSRFELIDLNHRWAGIAKLYGSLLSSLRDMPEDSALQSSLLRLALQKGYDQKTIDAQDGSLIKVSSNGHANEITETKIDNVHEAHPNAGFWDRYIFPTISKRIIKSLYRNSENRVISLNILGYVPLLLAIMAICFALLKINIISFGFAFLCTAALFVSHQFNKISLVGKNQDLTLYGTYILLLMGLMLSAGTIDDHLYIYSSLILFSLAFISQNISIHRPYDWLALSIADIYFVLIIAAIFQVQLAVIVAGSISFLFRITYATLPKPVKFEN